MNIKTQVCSNLRIQMQKHSEETEAHTSPTIPIIMFSGWCLIFRTFLQKRLYITHILPQDYVLHTPLEMSFSNCNVTRLLLCTTLRCLVLMNKTQYRGEEGTPSRGESDHWPQRPFPLPTMQIDFIDVWSVSFRNWQLSRGHFPVWIADRFFGWTLTGMGDGTSWLYQKSFYVGTSELWSGKQVYGVTRLWPSGQGRM